MNRVIFYFVLKQFWRDTVKCWPAAATRSLQPGDHSLAKNHECHASERHRCSANNPGELGDPLHGLQEAPGQIWMRHGQRRQ